VGAEAEIREVLEAQAAAWSQGDLEGYISRLASDVRYVTSDGLVVGRDVLRERYGAAFGSSGAMGQLALQIDRIEVVGEAAFVVLRWALTGSLADRGGHALLGFVHREGRWELSYDATLTATGADVG
jgi:uncharacterized protein (TIGR02246 family)